MEGVARPEKRPKAVHNLYLFVDTMKIGCVFYYYVKCINICGAERKKESKRQRQMAAADNTFDSLAEEKSYANLWFQWCFVCFVKHTCTSQNA